MPSHRILQINAASTLGCAVAMLAARSVLYPLFGLASPLLLDAVAIAFGGYAAALLATARRGEVSRGALLFFAVADGLWVAGSAVALLVWWDQLTPVACVLIVAVALVVEAFAALQLRAAGGLRRPARTVITAS